MLDRQYNLLEDYTQKYIDNSLNGGCQSLSSQFVPMDKVSFNQVSLVSHWGSSGGERHLM